MYQCAPPGGSASGPRGHEPDEALLRVEDVDERCEVELVGSAAVHEDERAGRRRRRPGARGGRWDSARRSRIELRQAACEERAVASPGSSRFSLSACFSSLRLSFSARFSSRRSCFSSRRFSFSALRSSRLSAFSSRRFSFSAARSGLPPVGGRPGCGCSCGGSGSFGGGGCGPPPGRPDVPPPPERSGPATEPPEEPDEAVSPRIPFDDVVGALGGGEGASEADFGGGEAVRASATISPACAVPRSGAGRLSRGRSPGRIIGASASSVMTALSATVQRACVPRRLPTVLPSAELPSDLNGSPRLRRLEPLKSSGSLATLPHSPAPAPRAHPAASGSSGCC